MTEITAGDSPEKLEHGGRRVGSVKRERRGGKGERKIVV